MRGFERVRTPHAWDQSGRCGGMYANTDAMMLTPQILPVFACLLALLPGVPEAVAADVVERQL